MNKILGIVNIDDNTVNVSGLMDYRPLPAITFLGRYRLIDIVLSNMTNSGLSHIQVYIKNKPRSLIEHLGNGSHFNINSKKGKLHLLHGEERILSEVYNHDVTMFMQNMQFIEESRQEYVVVAPSYILYTLDYNDVLEYHKEKEADITIVYKNIETCTADCIGCDTLTLDDNKTITEFAKNRGKFKNRNISLECYVMKRTLFIEIVKKAAKTSSLYSLKDILAECVDEYVIKGFSYQGQIAFVNTLDAYYEANMRLTDVKSSREFFRKDWPIHTKTNDSAPTLYTKNASVVGSSIANGCFIDGTVENSVIGRGVTIEKGAVVKNSVIAPGCYIGKDVNLDYAVVDKKAKIREVKDLVGTKQNLIYVKRRDCI